MYALVRRVGGLVFRTAMPGAYKHHHEMTYWRGRHEAEKGQLSNAHYEPLYTTVYGLTRADFAGQRVLDIGCGPRGSLEWADMAKQRVGIDPLVDEYRKLGADKHKMTYVKARSEKIPFADGSFDIVTCLNALDHVDDLDATIAEIKRVTKTGGLFLLSTEIGHPPTPTEPVTISAETLRGFAPDFAVVWDRLFGVPADHDLHGAVMAQLPPVPGEPNIYCARMQKRMSVMRH
jgi:2-polyprenyl-3-methyl-5-hydroxy-6-metoxy-1,4-benzoquinol methylase